MADILCTRVKRGQLFVADVFFAFVIILFLLAFTTSTSNSISDKAHDVEKRMKLMETAANALNQLLSTPGNPRDWNLLQNFSESTVSSIGIASEKAVLDKDKVEKFFNLTYSNSTYLALKTILGVTEPGYEFYAAVYYANRTPAYETSSLVPEGKEFSMLERIAVLEGQQMKINFGVWIE